MSPAIGPAEARTAVHEAIGSILPSLDAADIDGAKHLKELGADSVDRVEIIMQVLDRCSLSAPLSRFSDVPDVDHLVEFVAELQRGAPS